MIFDMHSDILSLLGKAPSSWEDRYLPMFTQGEAYGGLWVAWLNDRSSPSAMEREFLRLTALAPNLKGLGLIKKAGDHGALRARGLYPVLLGIEGLDGIPYSAEELFSLGFRHAMLTWAHANDYGGGNSAPPGTGLSPKGRRFLQEMERLSMLIDASHLNESSFWGLCEAAEGPFMASHSNAWALCPCSRNLKDEQIKEIARRKGLIGLVLAAGFVRPAEARLYHILDHARHILDLTGNEDILALGPDWCSFLNPEFVCVEGYHDASDSSKLPSLFLDAGFGEELVQKICWQNAVRYIETNLPQ